MGGECWMKKIFIFATNEGIKFAVEKFLEDCILVSAGSDDGNELTCSVMGA